MSARRPLAGLCQTAFAAAIASGTIAWAFLFLWFWSAMLNTNLATPLTPAMALPLAWLEMAVAALITQACFRRWDRIAGVDGR
jgi:hypothetical protein